MLPNLLPQHPDTGRQVDGGGLDVAVAEHLLEAEQVAAAFKHEGGEGVAVIPISA